MLSSDEGLSDSDEPDLSEVKEYWLKRLSYEPRIFRIEELAEMLDDKGWFISEFQRAFLELMSEGKVENIDAPRRRPKHAVHFKKGERLKKRKRER